ncbi:MAG: ATP-binding protein [Selenomonadaceae bacterium]|nr:ATP-binding protein [Selenomonadaceae bacterium]
MIDINFGVNIVEIVTKGLYTNSLDIFREYVQNACDSIDDAVKGGTFSQGDGKIAITIDEDNYRITIEDNGTGLSMRDFVRVMSNIGNSDKRRETDRGFRGIGRLGGLAYCKTLIFTSKIVGEKKVSTLTIDAEKLRKEFFSGRKRLAEHVLIENMKFGTFNATPDTPAHFFRVEMVDINRTNEDLLNVDKVRDYLSFVAPVAYSPQFEFRKKIYAHAAELNARIAEYDIRVNDKPLVKNYTSDIRTARGDDKIFDVKFQDFYDGNGELIAWMWFGLSEFKGVLSEAKITDSYKMRGIRLRMGNIQIGDWNVFGYLFKEDRGTKYFIGEVHAVDTDLIPNSRRDYFEENEAREAFESELKVYFEVLAKLVRHASNIRSAFNATNKPEEFRQKIAIHTTEYQETHAAEHEAELANLKFKAAENQDFIDKTRHEAEANPDEITSQVFVQIDANFEPLDDTDTGDGNTPPRSGFRRRIGRVRKPSFTMRSTK